jgi:hypothetical protein
MGVSIPANTLSRLAKAEATQKSAGKAPGAALKNSLEALLSKATLPKLSQKPDLRGFTKILIKDARKVDGPRIDAWYNPKTGTVFKQATSAGMAGPKTSWSGPSQLDERPTHQWRPR